MDILSLAHCKFARRYITWIKGDCHFLSDNKETVMVHRRASEILIAKALSLKAEKEIVLRIYRLR